MKKFLTVLLALSVVFTYTVGTAFATDTVDPVDKAYADAMTYAETMISSASNRVKAEQTAAGTYDASAITGTLQDSEKTGMQLAKDLATIIIANDPKGLSDDAKMTSFKNEINAWVGVTGAAATIIGSNPSVDYADDTFDAYFASKIADYDFPAKLEAAKALVNAVDPSNYTDKAIYSGKTHRQFAADQKTTFYNQLVALTKSSSITAIAGSDYTDAINAVLYGYDKTAGAQVVYTSKTPLNDLPQVTAGDKVAGLFGILEFLNTNEEQAVIDGNAEIDIDHAVSELTYYAKRTFYDSNKLSAGDSAVALDKADNATAAEDSVVFGVKVANTASVTAAEAAAINAALNARIADVLEVLDVYFDELTDKSATNVTRLVNALKANDSAFFTAINNAYAAKTFYGKVVAEGTDKKAEVEFDGSKKYNDADIDKALADAKAEVYGKYSGGYSTTVSVYFANVAPASDPIALALKAAQDKFQDTIKYTGADKTEEADKKYCKDYYAVGWKSEYEEIRDAAVKALNDVKTIDEITAIMADADAKLAKLRTQADNTTELTTSITQYKTALWKYANEQLDLMNGKNEYRVASFTDNANNDITSAYEAGADLLDKVLNINELPATYEAAKALFKDIKTKAELAAQAEKVRAMIAALPASVKLADEAKIMEAKDAYEAYLALYGAEDSDVRGFATFEVKLTTLKTLQENAVQDAIAAIDDDGKTTAEEVAAARAMYDKYVAYYDQYDEVFTIAALSLTALENAETAVWDAEVNAVKQLMAKLSTESSLDDINAAKKAYDALTGSQQRAVGKAYPYKIQLLTEKLIDAVESFKIVASSKLYKGKKIRVKWRIAAGDTSAIDGFKVYKSTKANSGYKYMGKTKKLYMDNKKGLKKGKRMFYRVRAYKVIDGKTYYSDYSNKANRIYK